MSLPTDGDVLNELFTGEFADDVDLPAEEEVLCIVCGHPPHMHDDKYGCEVERGDAWVNGESMGAYMALGPCGCTHWRMPDERLKQWLEVAYARFLLNSTRNLIDHVYRTGPSFVPRKRKVDA